LLNNPFRSRDASRRSPLLSTAGRAWMGNRSGDQQLRILAIMALTLALIGCQGDRVKQGMNSPQGSVVKSVSRSAA